MTIQELKELETKCLLDALKRQDIRAVQSIMTLALLHPLDDIEEYPSNNTEKQDG